MQQRPHSNKKKSNQMTSIQIIRQFLTNLSQTALQGNKQALVILNKTKTNHSPNMSVCETERVGEH